VSAETDVGDRQVFAIDFLLAFAELRVRIEAIPILVTIRPAVILVLFDDIHRVVGFEISKVVRAHVSHKQLSLHPLDPNGVAQAAGAKEPATKGSVVASDAFFPFADGLLVAIEAGATAVIQPGGSVRDDEVIKAADEHGIAMVFTGTRHFRH